MHTWFSLHFIPGKSSCQIIFFLRLNKNLLTNGTWVLFVYKSNSYMIFLLCFLYFWSIVLEPR